MQLPPTPTAAAPGGDRGCRADAALCLQHLSAPCDQAPAARVNCVPGMIAHQGDACDHEDKDTGRTELSGGAQDALCNRWYHLSWGFRCQARSTEQ